MAPAVLLMGFPLVVLGLLALGTLSGICDRGLRRRFLRTYRFRACLPEKRALFRQASRLLQESPDSICILSPHARTHAGTPVFHFGLHRAMPGGGNHVGRAFLLPLNLASAGPLVLVFRTHGLAGGVLTPVLRKLEHARRLSATTGLRPAHPAKNAGPAHLLAAFTPGGAALEQVLAPAAGRCLERAARAGITYCFYRDGWLLLEHPAGTRTDLEAVWGAIEALIERTPSPQELPAAS